jgi:hypothetical protein
VTLNDYLFGVTSIRQQTFHLPTYVLLTLLN